MPCGQRIPTVTLTGLHLTWKWYDTKGCFDRKDVQQDKDIVHSMLQYVVNLVCTLRKHILDCIQQIQSSP